MALDFTVKDIFHKVVVKFVHAFLPDAKKPYNLKAVLRSELDLHGVASKFSPNRYASLGIIHIKTSGLLY